MKGKVSFKDKAQLLEYVNRYDANRVKSQLSGYSKRTQKIAQMCVESTKEMLVENADGFVGSANVANYTPIIIPLVTRLIPQLFTLNLVGVQPMKTPVGEAFGIRYYYQGNDGKDATSTYSNVLTMSNSLICVLDGDGTTEVDPLANTPYTLTSSDGLGGNGDAHGVKIVPVHTEKNKTLVKIVDFNSKSLAAIMADINTNADTTVTFTVGGTDYELTGVMTNDDSIKKMFKHYSGSMETNVAEENHAKRSKLSVAIVSQLVKAQTRELGADVSIYAYEDAMASHGFDIQNEILVSGAYTMSREIDAEVMEAISEVAEENGVFVFDFANVTGHTNEITKVQTMLIAINDLAKDIAKNTRSGRPNWLTVGATVASLLESLPTNQFQPSKSVSPTGEGFIGVLNSRYNVYLDNQMDDVELIIGYKGASELDTGIVFCPYRPIASKTAVGEVDFRFKNLFNSRYAVVKSLYRAKDYYRKMKLKNITFLTSVE